MRNRCNYVECVVNELYGRDWMGSREVPVPKSLSIFELDSMREPVLDPAFEALCSYCSSL